MAELSKLLREVEKDSENVFTVTKEALKDGNVKSTVALGNRTLWPDNPPRLESRRRGHVFNEINGFAGYLAKYGSDNTVVLADVDEQMCTVDVKATLDETVEYGREIIYFQPKLHPLFSPWHYRVTGSAIDLDHFVEFVQQNRRSIIEPDGKELSLLLQQLKISNKTEVYRGRGNKSVNGVKVELEIQGNPTSDILDLPESVTVLSPLFMNRPELRIEVDITLLPYPDKSGGEVKVQMTSPDYKAKVLQETGDMLNKMSEKLSNDGVVLAYGHLQYSPWETVQSIKPY